jgi:hypothetical protein
MNAVRQICQSIQDLSKRGFLVGLGGLFLLAEFGHAAGKKPSDGPLDGKKVIAIAPINNVQIEMPDQSKHDFGADYQASLTDQLIGSGRYLVSDPLPLDDKSRLGLNAIPTPGYSWDGRFIPSATVKVHVEALNFSTGARGDSTFYGFDERQKNPFNDGSRANRNEFPLKLLFPDSNWFGSTFKSKGIMPFDSRSGLDLGDGFNLDVLFAWLTVKYARYHSELHLTLEIETPEVGKSESRWIQVTGDGFFFDVAGRYDQYSLGISMARKDAMEQAVRKALNGSFSAIDRALLGLPLMARVDAVMKDGTILIGTGFGAEVRAGVLYEVVGSPELVIEVTSSVASGAQGRVAAGDLSQVRAEQILRQVSTLPEKNLPTKDSLRGLASAASSSVNKSLPTVFETIALDKENFSKIDFQGSVLEISRWVALGKSLAEAIFLPYRIWRYFMYDQTYHKNADIGIDRSRWMTHSSLSQLPQMEIRDESRVPVVAVIDSGMDYNHPILHESLWLNLDPSKDPNGRKDRYGWDFVSNDSRPFDDHFHGTQVASVVAQVAPFAKIMPLKVFNPWGITNSSAIYSAFVYAVDHGATIILCAWATHKSSQAMEMGVDYARQKGVVVVAAAGDDGMNLNFVPYYPADFSRRRDHVITVTASSDEGQLSQISGRKVSYSSSGVQLAAPGSNIRVAEPRAGQAVVTSTGIAAAFVAGALARYSVQDLQEERSQAYRNWIDDLYHDADVVPTLKPYVQNGLRLNIKR